MLLLIVSTFFILRNTTGLGYAGSGGVHGETPPPFTEKDALALLKKNGTFDKFRLQIKEQLQSSVCNTNYYAYIIVFFKKKYFPLFFVNFYFLTTRS